MRTVKWILVGAMVAATMSWTPAHVSAIDGGGSGGAADGTIWPFSGCDVSAGICCHKKCGTGC